ncbi:T9SS type A sorting domain-containing protein [bacterium]|nr:T9SS type A sorting domain-containing protein [bacterium]
MHTQSSLNSTAPMLGIALLFTLLTAGAQTITEFPIATGPDTCYANSAACTGSAYLIPIVGDDKGSHSLTVQMVSNTGSLIGERIYLGTGVQESALAAFDGSRFLICWNDFETRLWGSFLSANGSPAGDPFLIASYGWIGNNSLIFAGGSYCVVYEDTLTPPGNARLIYARFISPSGVAGEPVQLSQSEGFLDGGLAFDGTSFLAAWRGGGQNTPSINGQFFTGNGTVGGNIVIDGSSYNSDNPVSVTWDGTRYLVIFSDEVDAGNDIWHVYGRFVTPARQVQERITIADNGNYNFGFSAFDGSAYLVTYHHFYSYLTQQIFLRGRYFDTSGNAIGDEFTIAAPLNSKIPIGGVKLFDGTHFVAGLNRVAIVIHSREDIELTEGDVYGIFISPSPTSVGDDPFSPPPAAFILGQNYPNPFNPSTLIPYQVSSSADVTISIFNLRGVEVMRCTETAVSPGNHTVQWDGRDRDGKRVPAGVYCYRVEAATAAGTWSHARKMILLQ